MNEAKDMVSSRENRGCDHMHVSVLRWEIDKSSHPQPRSCLQLTTLLKGKISSPRESWWAYKSPLRADCRLHAQRSIANTKGKHWLFPPPRDSSSPFFFYLTGLLLVYYGFWLCIWCVCVCVCFLYIFCSLFVNFFNYCSSVFIICLSKHRRHGRRHKG